MAVDIPHELFQAVLCVEDLLTWLPALDDSAVSVMLRTHIPECYLDAGIEIGKLSHACRHDVILVCCCGEYRIVWPELLACSAFLCLADNLHGVERMAFPVFLLVYLAVAVDL